MPLNPSRNTTPLLVADYRGCDFWRGQLRKSDVCNKEPCIIVIAGVVTLTLFLVDQQKSGPYYLLPYRGEQPQIIINFPDASKVSEKWHMKWGTGIRSGFTIERRLSYGLIAVCL